MPDWMLPLLLFATAFLVLLSGFPVAFSLGGAALLFATAGSFFGVFDPSFLSAIPERMFGIIKNDVLLAIPMFVFMGVVLERSKISENLLQTMAELFGGLRGGLGISVCLVGGLLAASTGIVGATVVAMGLISFPAMRKSGYSPALSSGLICAAGTLGQIIPPSVVLIVLGDVVGSAYQQAQLASGNFAPSTVSVSDLFVGALLPGLVLVGAFMIFLLVVALVKPDILPATPRATYGKALWIKAISALVPPLLLITGVLGSILGGIATATEAASVGCFGALGLTFLQRQASWRMVREAAEQTAEITAMIGTILVGASLFSLVFRGLGGDDAIRTILGSIGGGDVTVSFWLVMAVIFALGFFIDFFEIVYVVVPVVGPVLLEQGLDPLWLGVMIAINLQTSFLTPPFGFALFYLRSVLPPDIPTSAIYRGVVPFILLQLLVLALVWFFPALATWLPSKS